MRRRFAEWEDEIITSEYPRGGTTLARRALAAKGSARSQSSVYRRAKAMGLTFRRPVLWRPVLPLTVNPERPRTAYEKRRALFHLAESNPTPEEYEAVRARILEGKT